MPILLMLISPQPNPDPDHVHHFLRATLWLQNLLSISLGYHLPLRPLTQADAEYEKFDPAKHVHIDESAELKLWHNRIFSAPMLLEQEEKWQP